MTELEEIRRDIDKLSRVVAALVTEQSPAPETAKPARTIRNALGVEFIVSTPNRE